MKNIFPYINADEIFKNSNYGEDFLNELRICCEDKKILENEAIDLIKCLVDADETRDVFCNEIRCLIKYAVKMNISTQEVVIFINRSNKFYCGCETEYYFIKGLYSEVLNGRNKMPVVLKKLEGVG